MKPVIVERGDQRVELWRCRWQDWTEPRSVDAIVTDPPYSLKTHKGHNETHAISGGKVERKKLEYEAWSSEHVAQSTDAWSEWARGWIVVMTDNVLAPAWISGLEHGGRKAFAPLPFTHLGSRVRLAGDGPSSWTVWIVVARPRSREFAAWGTLPGEYRFEKGMVDDRQGTGGKPTPVLQSIVRDYTRPTNVVLDPCAGWGTTGVAALREGRSAVLLEPHPERFEAAVERVRKEAQQEVLFRPEVASMKQVNLIEDT